MNSRVKNNAGKHSLKSKSLNHTLYNIHAKPLNRTHMLSCIMNELIYIVVLKCNSNQLQQYIDTMYHPAYLIAVQ